MMGREEVAMLRAACVLATVAVAAGLGATPLPELDPFLPGTKWGGTLTQKGTFGRGAAGPPSFDTVLTVTARYGDRFEADLAESSGDVRVTYRVKGSITPVAGGVGYAVGFKSISTTGAVNTNPVLGVPYEGILAGKSLRGTWRVSPNGPGTLVEGDFALELGK
jgi:hypothetical protein